MAEPERRLAVRPGPPGQAVPTGQDLAERVLVPYPIESALSGIQRREDRMCYRRTFTVPAGWQIGAANRLKLNFGAVDYDAKVFVNGTQVATHRGGYDRFDVDVTGALTGSGPQEPLQYSGADQRFAMSFAGVRALSPAKPEPGRWYHLVGVRDTVRGELRLYVDGELAGTAPACLPQGGRTGSTVIGRGKFGGNPVDYLDGVADQVHLYDRLLSAAEIRELHASNQ